MNQPTLLPLIRKFLKLETLAHELYLTHLPHVPAFAKRDFQEFIKTEEHHRRMFERLYREVGGVPRHPHFPVSVFLMRSVAHILSLAGFATICRFECAVERRAIADYEDALRFVKRPTLRRTIQRVLHDEKQHPSLEALLTRFQHDEEEHVARMQKTLQKKISTPRR